MKAQSLRRLVTLANVALVLGILGAGALYVTQSRPAAADAPKRATWIAASVESLNQDIAHVKPTTTWTVREDDFNHIIRPDLMDPKKGFGVWPFVGPEPVFVKPVETQTVTKVEVKGLAAMGHLAAATLAAATYEQQPDGSMKKIPGRSVITFVFGDGPTAHRRPFAVGDDDPIEDKEVKAADAQVVGQEKPPRRPGKYLVSAEFAGEDGQNPLIKIVYDEVGADPSKPERKEETLPIKQDSAPSKQLFGPLTTASGDGSKKPGAGGSTGKVAPVAAGATTPPPVSAPAEARLESSLVSENRWRVQIPDDVDYDSFAGKSIDDVVSKVTSEDVDPKNDPRGGARFTGGIVPGGLANQFGVQPGDILRSINGTPVHSRNDAINIVKGLPKGTTSATVVITRDGQDRTYDVDLRDPKVRAAAGKLKTK